MVTLEDFLLFEMLIAGGGVAFSGTTVFFPTAILGAAVGRGPGTTWPIPPAGGFDTGTAVAGGGAENRPGGGLKAGRFGPAPSATLSLFLIAATCGAPAMAIAGGGAAAARVAAGALLVADAALGLVAVTGVAWADLGMARCCV